MPGSLDGGPTFKSGHDALVLGKASRAARQWKQTISVSRRWRSLADDVLPWWQLRRMEKGGSLNWEMLRVMADDDGARVWAASSTSREEGKQDKWHTVRAPGGDRSVILVRKCNEEGVSYDVVRWMGCLQALHHPCIAALQLARAELHHRAVHAAALARRCGAGDAQRGDVRSRRRVGEWPMRRRAGREQRTHARTHARTPAS